MPAVSIVGRVSGVSDDEDFREPFRSQFIQIIEEGGASVDIHDVQTAAGFAVRSARSSAAFLQRELDRPYRHVENICRWIQRLKSVGRVLDVGCGTAGLSVALAWTFPNAMIDCFDADELSVKAAGARAAGYGFSERIRPRLLAPNSSFPFETESFDLVTCTSVLEFITKVEDRSQLLEEIRRVMRPGGYVVFTTPNPWHPFEFHSGRLLGNWRRRAGFPWASRGGWIRSQLPNCEFLPTYERVASKFGLNLPNAVCRFIEPLMRWQFLLAQAAPDGNRQMSRIFS